MLTVGRIVLYDNVTDQKNNVSDHIIKAICVVSVPTKTWPRVNCTHWKSSGFLNFHEFAGKEKSTVVVSVVQ
jgi:hypothetical protein